MAANILKCILLKEHVCTLIKVSLKVVARGSVSFASSMFGSELWPLLLTWFNFNPTMDK